MSKGELISPQHTASSGGRIPPWKISRLASSSQAAYHSPRHKCQGSLTPLLVLSPEKRFALSRGPRFLRAAHNGSDAQSCAEQDMACAAHRCPWPRRPGPRKMSRLACSRRAASLPLGLETVPLRGPSVSRPRSGPSALLATARTLSIPGAAGRWRRRWCTRAATGAPPCRSRRGGSWR